MSNVCGAFVCRNVHVCIPLHSLVRWFVSAHLHDRAAAPGRRFTLAYIGLVLVRVDNVTVGLVHGQDAATVGFVHGHAAATVGIVHGQDNGAWGEVGKDLRIRRASPLLLLPRHAPRHARHRHVLIQPEGGADTVQKSRETKER